MSETRWIWQASDWRKARYLTWRRVCRIMGARRSMAKTQPKRTKLSKKQQRDLDIEIEFMEGVVRRDPSYIDALQILGDDYTRRGKFVNGLKIDEQLVQLRPSEPITHYNLACSYSLTGQIERAIASLERAVDLGYRDFTWMSKDPDLTDLRTHPAYIKLRARLRKLKAKS